VSAAILREAATLMRALASEPPVPAGPWETEFSDVIRTDVPFGEPGYLLAECATIPEAKHIASWHPAVAVAVAGLLEEHADGWDAGQYDVSQDDHALAVAHTYLAEVDQ
jgi:hypothetical protein